MLTGLLVLVVKIAATLTQDSPHYFPKCCIDDPYLDNCLVNAANFLAPYLKDGVPELELEPLGPLVLPTFSITDQGPNFNYSFRATDSTFYNMHGFVMKQMHFDPETLTLSGKVLHERIPYHFNAIMGPNGRIVHLNLKGTGRVEGVLGGVETTFIVRGRITNRLGTDYLEPISTTTFQKTADHLARIVGLFGNDKQLETNTNEWLVENSKTIGKAMSPVFEKIIEKFLNHYTTSLTRNTPFGKLFPSCYD